jgi:hypothetical protein
MNGLMMHALLASLPPGVADELKRMKETLESTGTAEGTFPIPDIGACKVTITKVEASNG